MKQRNALNGLMILVLIAAMLPVQGPLAARTIPEPTQRLIVSTPASLSMAPDLTAGSNWTNAYQDAHVSAIGDVNDSSHISVNRLGRGPMGGEPATPITFDRNTRTNMDENRLSATKLNTCFARINDEATTYDSIQAAVDVAQPGDTVKVAGYCSGVEGRLTPDGFPNSGTIISQTVYISKSITLEGGYLASFADQPDAVANPTTLDAKGQGRVLFITGSISVTLEGLHITNGDATGLGGHSNRNGDGGGVYVGGADTTLKRNRIISNTAPGYGGGMLAVTQNLVVDSNQILANIAGDDGGGLMLLGDASAPTPVRIVVNNVICKNQALDIDGIRAGGGLELYNTGSTPTTIANNTLCDNSTANANGGGGISLFWTAAASLSNNILWGNTGGNNSQIDNAGNSDPLVVSYSDVQGGYSGAGNLDCEPNFIDPANNDFHVQAGSCVIGAGDNAAVTTPTDLDGNPRIVNGVVDMGAYEHQGLVHLIALLSFDNNLSSQAPEVIERFRIGALANPAVRVTLLVDQVGEDNTEIVQIANGVVTHTNSIPWEPGIHELNTASPDVIAAFLTWARAQQLAKRIVVTMLGHGAGLTPEIHSIPAASRAEPLSAMPLPIGRDPTPVDVHSGAYLSTSELGRALDAATNHGANPYDVLFLDQCFGGGLDMLYEVRQAASVLVASPNYAWGAFAYDRYLPQFTASATPGDLAQAIIDGYEAALDDTHPNAIFWLHSAAITATMTAVSDLGDVLRNSTLPGSDILAAALDSQFIDTTLCANDWQLCAPDEEIGLRSFAAQLQARTAVGSAVYTAAGQVLTALAGVHSNGTHTMGTPWLRPGVHWDLTSLGPTVIAPLTKTLAASGDVWRASLYTATVPLTTTLAWSPTQTVAITTPWASTVNSGWARFLATWYGPLTPTIGLWCNTLPPALVVTGTDTITLTAQGELRSAQLTWTPVVTPTAVNYAVYILRPGGTWELAASLPLTQTAFTHPDLTSGVYRYFVVARNAEAQVMARSSETPVDVGVTSIMPGYGLNNVPTMMYVQGGGFVGPITITMGALVLSDVTVLDAHALHAVIPAGLTPGAYDLTVSTTAGQVMVPNAFRAIDAGVVDDLTSSPDQLTTDPTTVYATYLTQIGFWFQRLGGKNTLPDVTVTIRVNGVVLSNTWTTPVPPNSTASASPVEWQPSASGTYEICAILDPENVIPESDETNNTICKTIPVLPVAAGMDLVPPVVDGFVIGHDLAVSSILTTTLTVTATDPLPNPSGVKCVKFYEFEWSQGAQRWLPLVRSGCLDYLTTPADYPWLLLNIPGVRYMEAWAQDNAGNLSLAPGIDIIDLLPSAQAGYIAQNGVVFYRFYVRQGQSVMARLDSQDGDSDLYVWGPGDQLWHSNNGAGQADQVAFNAPSAGTYQIEVHGYMAAHYRLNLGSGGGQAASLQARTTDKPLPTAPAVPLDSCPNGRCSHAPEWPSFKINLPLIRR